MKRRLLISTAAAVLVLALTFAVLRPTVKTPSAGNAAALPQNHALDFVAHGGSETADGAPTPPPQSKTDVFAEIGALGEKPEMGRRLALVEKLAALGAGHEGTLADALRSARTSAERGIIADALARIGTSEAVDVLLGTLNAMSDSPSRSDVLQAFNALPPGPAVETLASSLQLQLDPQVRDAVVATIARTADADTVQFLHEMYREPEAFGGQTANVLAALGSIHNPGAATPLAELLRQSREVPIMQNVASSLGKIGTPDSLQAVADCLRTVGDTNPELRQFLLGVVQSVTNNDAREWLQTTAAAVAADPALAQAAKTALAAMKSEGS